MWLSLIQHLRKHACPLLSDTIPPFFVNLSPRKLLRLCKTNCMLMMLKKNLLLLHVFKTLGRKIPI